MKTIQLKSIRLLNFKGLRNETFEFEKKQNFVYGDNATGKTTIFDAFTWLLFGKDSSNRADFNLKTINGNGKPIPRIDHEVEAVIMINDDEITLKRILKENWVKKRGNLIPEFSGNQTEYFWNEVPVKKTEFDKNVSELLDEAIFRLITNPLAFTSLHWEKQRSQLVDIAGIKSDEELAKGNNEFERLLSKLSQNKTFEQYQAQIKSSIKKAKERIKTIPSRIDEVDRSKPLPLDYRRISKQLEEKQSELEKVVAKLEDSSKAFDLQMSEQKELQLQKAKIQNKVTDIELKLRSKAKSKSGDLQDELNKHESEKSRLTYEIARLESDLNGYNAEMKGKKVQIKALESEMNQLRNDFSESSKLSAKFDDEDFKCPTCKRAFDDDEIEKRKQTMIKNFNANKSKKLEAINQNGTELKATKESLEKAIPKLDSLQKELTSKIDELTKEKNNVIGNIVNLKQELQKPQNNWEHLYNMMIQENEQLNKLSVEIDDLDHKIDDLKLEDTNSEKLRAEKKSISSEIDELKTHLLEKEQIKKADARIKELMEEEKTLSQQIANVEREEHLIEEFQKLKFQDLENRVNEKFDLVSFKMFETQINGGIKNTCEAMVDGVPFSDLNNAMKINAGLEIIKVLCDFYKVNAPIFIDNRESVTKLIDIDSQIINLVVSEQDKQLRIA